MHEPPVEMKFFKEEMTQLEVAKALGVSRSLVWQIEKRALAKLRKEFAKKYQVYQSSALLPD
jgi:DNA-directed RNA polymerase specialized sigma subunit